MVSSQAKKQDYFFLLSKEREETMTDLAIQKRREYYKEWYERNKDRRKAYIEKYWEKKAKGEMQK